MRTSLVCILQLADQASKNEAMHEVLDQISKDHVMGQEL